MSSSKRTRSAAVVLGKLHEQCNLGNIVGQPELLVQQAGRLIVLVDTRPRAPLVLLRHVDTGALVDGIDVVEWDKLEHSGIDNSRGCRDLGSRSLRLGTRGRGWRRGDARSLRRCILTRDIIGLDGVLAFRYSDLAQPSRSQIFHERRLGVLDIFSVPLEEPHGLAAKVTLDVLFQESHIR